MVGFKLFNFTHELLALSLRTRAARHEVLSANIANADTPGYRPKDLDFNAVMKSAVEASSNGRRPGWQSNGPGVRGYTNRPSMNRNIPIVARARIDSTATRSVSTAKWRC